MPLRLVMAQDDTCTFWMTRLQEASVTKRMLRTPPVLAALSRNSALALAAAVTKVGKRVADLSVEPVART